MFGIYSSILRLEKGSATAGILAPKVTLVFQRGIRSGRSRIGAAGRIRLTRPKQEKDSCWWLGRGAGRDASTSLQVALLLAAPLSMTAHDDFFLISSAKYWNDWGCGKQIQAPVCKLLNPDNSAARYCILRS